MLKRLSQSIRFVSAFTASKVGKTGLTVTVDVYKNGSLVVSGTSATETGAGLYSYTLAGTNVDTAGAYIAVFKTSDTTVDQQWVYSYFDAGEDWVQYVDTTVSSRSTYSGADTAGTTTLLSRIASALTITGGKVDVNDKSGFSLATAPPTAAAIRSEIDANSTRLAQLAVDVAALPASVWANGTRTLTSFGTLAADVWAVATRSLTDKTGFSLATVPPTAADIAAAVWNAATRTLSAFGFTVATTANATETATLTAVQALPTAAQNATATRTALPEIVRLDANVSSRATAEDVEVTVSGGFDDEAATQLAEIASHFEGIPEGVPVSIVPYPESELPVVAVAFDGVSFGIVRDGVEVSLEIVDTKPLVVEGRFEVPQKVTKITGADGHPGRAIFEVYPSSLLVAAGGSGKYKLSAPGWSRLVTVPDGGGLLSALPPFTSS